MRCEVQILKIYKCSTCLPCGDPKPASIAEFAAEFLSTENPPEKFEYPNHTAKASVALKLPALCLFQ